MKIAEITAMLETLAPPLLQETYDNAGLLTGNLSWSCTGILCTLDVTEEIVLEAHRKKCNLIVAHHPIIFKGLKKITGKDYVEQTIIAAIKNDIAIYAIHTNLDNIMHGVNNKIADKLNLIHRKILEPKQGQLFKLFTFVPRAFADKLRNALFNAGAGNIGNYSECSFNSEGTGTFTAGPHTQPFTGSQGIRHEENEIKMEMIFPAWLQQNIITALVKNHPYEEVAYDIVPLANDYLQTGSGMTGELENEISEEQLLKNLKEIFSLSVIKHTPLLGKPIKKLAICGGSGSFLIQKAISSGATVYITSDVKYHEFFRCQQ